MISLIWDRFETLSRQDMERLQLERLRAVVRRVYAKVPFYRRLFGEQGIKPAHIKSLDDLRRLPFTLKKDLRENYPFGLFSVPREQLVQVHASPGPNDRPIVVGYTKKDLRTWADLVARVVVQGGVTTRDMVQICFTYGLYTGGFGLHYGLEKAGATIVPASSGNTERQIRLMKDFMTTVLVSTPSYALYMGEVARELGIQPRELGVRLGLFGSEPWSEGMRAEIEAVWGLKAVDNYGPSELIGPGVAGECAFQQGLHISEDHFLPEIIDPVTLEPLPPGHRGELVITTLTKEGLPLIRYRTHELTALDYSPCTCGRTTVRMKRITDRTDDMLIIRGIGVFPSQIEEAITQVDGVGQYYLIIVDREKYLDSFEVLVELNADHFTDRQQHLQNLEHTVKNKIRSILGLTPRVRLVEHQSLERVAGEAKRVIDNRKL